MTDRESPRETPPEVEPVHRQDPPAERKPGMFIQGANLYVVVVIVVVVAVVLLFFVTR